VRRILARGIPLAFFGFTLFLTIRLALTETISRQHPERALEAPALFRDAASLVRFDSSPSELRAAVRLNPRLASAWIYLGLDAEADGDLAEAEQDLLQAARVDRQYVPAWTIANFYFRRGDTVNFWPWAAGAASLTFDDYRPLLRLADALETSPQEVVTRLAGGAPLLRAYLDLLIGAGRLDAAQEIAGLLAGRHDPADRARLADFAARQLSAGQTK
jgi:tetratricopeptide (TPR) repeat protein